MLLIMINFFLYLDLYFELIFTSKSLCLLKDNV